jgi:DNA invertase Pin-like site-specific DNA recombinase
MGDMKEVKDRRWFPPRGAHFRVGRGSMENLIGLFAEFERDLIRERVRAGLENARRKGKRPGRRPYFNMASLGTMGRLRGIGG